MADKRTQILSTLLPAHPDFQPILNMLRDKYNLPEGGILDSDYAEQLMSRTNIPWETIREEIKTEIENIPNFWPKSMQNLFKSFRDSPKAKTDPEAFIDTLNIEQEEIRAFMKGMYGQYFIPLWRKLDEFVSTTTDLLLIYLATGETKEIPFDWVGGVSRSTAFGEPVVFAIAGQLSDPKDIAQRFMTENNLIFGKDRQKISREFANNVDLLRMKFEHVALKDIADEYIQRNRSQFARDEQSPSYRAQKRRLEERFKKQFQRHEKTLRKLVGDISKTN
ncbi:MAG: hypothetical protein WD751_11945 [Anaerolineales bacterium]